MTIIPFGKHSNLLTLYLEKYFGRMHARTSSEVVAHYFQTIVNGEKNLYTSAILVAEELARRFRFEFRRPTKNNHGAMKDFSDSAHRAIEVMEIDEELMQNLH